MFGLRVPLTKSLSSPDFDGVQTIFHSSGLREPSFWLSKVNDRGEIFHLEIDDEESDNYLVDKETTSIDKESLCVCSDCATDDTGYGTDTDVVVRKERDEVFHQNSEVLISECNEIDDLIRRWNHKNFTETESLQSDFRLVEENIDNLFSSNKKCDNLEISESGEFDFVMPDDISSIFGCSVASILDSDQHVGRQDRDKFVINDQNEISSLSSSTPQVQTSCQCSARNESNPCNMEEQRQVVLKLKNHRGKPLSSNTVEMCEQVLGIVPGHYGSGKHKKRNKDGRRVKVRGIVPLGVASKHPEIHVGDWLKSINGQSLTWDNLHSTVQALLHQKQIKLLVQRMPRQLDRSVVLLKKNQSMNDRMVQLVTGSHDSTVSSLVTELDQEPFYSAMYLSLEGLSSETMHEKEDVLYQFPRGNSKMVDIRGLFVTLSGVVHDATESTVHSSVLVCEGTEINIAYHKEGSNLLLMSVPHSRLSVSSLHSLVNDIIRVLQVLYGSVHDALSSANQKQLDCFFSLLHHTYILQSKNIDTVQSRGHCLGSSIQSLPLPNDIKMIVDKTLTDFEAADFGDMSDVYYGCRRRYSILGSCLFYKSFLLCNHLPCEDLIDISSYLRCHALFTLTSDLSLGQLVLWREVHPTRLCHSVGEEQTFGYSEPVHGRWFWLIIGYKHMILNIMLEAGGCTTVKTGISTPDPFLIDQAKVVLMQLDAHDIQAHCQASVSHTEGPPTVHPDQFCVQRSKLDMMQKLLKKTPPKDNNNHMHLEDGNHSTSLVRKVLHGRKYSLGSDGSSESGGSDPFFRATRKGRLFPEVTDSYPYIHEEVNLINTARKLTVGAENCLFHYQYFDNLEGVFIASSQEASSSHMNKEVFENFHRCCVKIKAMFDTARFRKEQRKEGRDHVLEVNNDFTYIREEGILFQTTPADDKSLPLTYWVVGRCLSRSMRREVYVCFLDNTPQTVIELAFKLILGYLP